MGRGPGAVQIGLDPGHGTVLDGLTAADVALLDDLTTGLDDARLARIEDPERAARAHRLVQLLAGRGVLLHGRRRPNLAALGAGRARLAPDAATWSVVHHDAGDGWHLLAERSRRTVEIRGGGRTGLTLASTLAAAGVGAVRVRAGALTSPGDVAPGGARPHDVGVPLQDAAHRAIARALGREPSAADGSDPAPGPAADAGAGGGADPARADLVVLLDRGAADASRADQLLAQDVPHLSVVVRETSIVVGPLVLPGRGPCLRCLDLHRSERDRQWPLVLAQLVSSEAALAAPREETASAQLAAGLAALQVLGQLDGLQAPSSIGATLEIELPDGLVSRRPWPAHASCGCHWPLPPTRSTPTGTTSAGTTAAGPPSTSIGSAREITSPLAGASGPDRRQCSGD